MAWIKLDDGFFRHPKALRAGRDGRILFVAGLCYAGSGLTDGFIPAGSIPLLAAETGIAKPKSAVSDLVDAGLWKPCEGGYQIHDYLKYNSSSDKVQTEREAAKERMSRRRSPEVRPNNSRSSENVQQPEEKRRETDAETEKGDTPKPPSVSKQNIDGFDTWYKLYPRKESRVAAEKAWQKMTGLERLDAIDGLPRFLPAYASCEKHFIPLPATWLNGKRWLDEETPPIKTTGKVIAQRDNLPTDDDWSTGAGWLNENGVASL